MNTKLQGNIEISPKDLTTRATTSEARMQEIREVVADLDKVIPTNAETLTDFITRTGTNVPLSNKELETKWCKDLSEVRLGLKNLLEATEMFSGRRNYRSDAHAVNFLVTEATKGINEQERVAPPWTKTYLTDVATKYYQARAFEDAPSHYQESLSVLKVELPKFKDPERLFSSDPGTKDKALEELNTLLFIHKLTPNFQAHLFNLLTADAVWLRTNIDGGKKEIHPHVYTAIVGYLLPDKLEHIPNTGITDYAAIHLVAKLTNNGDDSKVVRAILSESRRTQGAGRTLPILKACLPNEFGNLTEEELISRALLLCDAISRDKSIYVTQAAVNYVTNSSAKTGLFADSNDAPDQIKIVHSASLLVLGAALDHIKAEGYEIESSFRELDTPQKQNEIRSRVRALGIVLNDIPAVHRKRDTALVSSSFSALEKFLAGNS